ncbi:aquaporin Z [Pseudomonas proteolytica]|uniref:Aquaporin Z n=1 Tax=Pseudomonas proteolytica TaxID=219574 RepID=A0AAW4ZZT3_9PSED|nr:aquaporin Z [Pseudomonas proteolytica]KAA8698168.1 aquaporin Z [Pseudomonas proteolytica]MCF5055805.1 aquaporin Z [Pseudomonas proteolytica]MCF5103087.1 aquaporin Z [Pseudomonas proteolytica]NMZ05529.1 aquaporin Z [Pseudomonas proteolytica]TWR71019.1 aquaporin Z [Pseudomonas proteolytica]
MQQKIAAEFLGTFWLTFGGCGSAILSAAFPGMGIGFAGVALAFGLSVLTMSYAVGSISGAHFNPAITVGLWVGGRMPGLDVLPYIIAQVAGATVAAAILALIASGRPGFELGEFAANGYGALSPGQYSLLAALVVETVGTFFLVFIVMRVTTPGAAPGFAPIAVGLTLTLIHLVSIPVTNTSVNPARSTGTALFAGTDYLMQLWLFWLAPLAGGIVGAWVARGVRVTAK